MTVSITDPERDTMYSADSLKNLKRELGEATDQVGFAIETLGDLQDQNATREFGEMLESLDDIYGTLRYELSRFESFLKNRYSK